MFKAKHKPNRPSVKAVLFDLDDTLFDHRHSSRNGLAAVQESYLCFRKKTLDELERDHLLLLNDLHSKVLQGVLSLEEARMERFRKLFLKCGEDVPAATAEAAAASYRQVYQASRRPIPGAMPLLMRLKAEVKVAVVTNNLAAEQRDKLERCGLTPFIDVLVVSEEVGVAKPEPGIFQEALSRVGCTAEEVVMVGDSWEADILGAHGVGIRAVWLNRYSLHCPDSALADQIDSFEPLGIVLELLLKGRPKSP
jgi:putative hydrolase of the HAD superfamily